MRVSKKFKWRIKFYCRNNLEHSEYRPDLAPIDGHLLPAMKEILCGYKFQDCRAVETSFVATTDDTGHWLAQNLKHQQPSTSSATDGEGAQNARDVMSLICSWCVQTSSPPFRSRCLRRILPFRPELQGCEGSAVVRVTWSCLVRGWLLRRLFVN